MSTVLRAGNRRCDAVCHNALGEHCGCICNGKYHGANVQAVKAEAQQEIKKLLRDKAVAQVEQAFERASHQPDFDFYGDRCSDCGAPVGKGDPSTCKQCHDGGLSRI